MRKLLGMFRSIRLIVMGVAVTSLIGLGFLAPSLASASPPPSAGASPDLQACSPAAGTVTAETATSNRMAFMPTNLESSFINGPGNIDYTVSSTSDVTATVTSGITIDAGFLFASASANYGVSLAASNSNSSSWTYDEAIPSGYTAAVQQYKESSDLGVHEVVEGYLSGGRCTSVTRNSASGNFFPYSSKTQNTYCYAITVDHTSSLGPQVASACTDTL